MESERDPRIDPRPGDVILSRNDLVPFEVRRIYSDGSICGVKGQLYGSLCGLTYWRSNYAKDAEVIKRGE